MTDDKKEKKANIPQLKMQVGTRTIEEKPITIHIQSSIPEAEFKARQKK
jgi:hypothetical protein